MFNGLIKELIIDVNVPLRLAVCRIHSVIERDEADIV
jgi:hypothetical protein